MQFDQLGPYRLGKRLGQGGMGAVYEVVEITSGEEAAIKVLAPSLAADAGFRVRFEAEIESLKKLRHPNIVRLYGYGEQSGTLFYAMELVRGTSLEDELRRGRRFEWREVTAIAIKLCRALKHAHDHGVVHRDLKPANLLVTPDGDVKLSDFGIARLFGNTRLTSDGGVLGTAEYMAPEQAGGRAVTERCDQYSLGGVMYALLAGRPPFRAHTLVEMLQMQRYAEPEPIGSLAPDTPPELARIINQLLEKDPKKRFPNTLLLARALEAMERGLSVAAPDDDQVTLTPPDVGQSAYDPLAATLSADEYLPADRPEPASATPRQAALAARTNRDSGAEAPAKSDDGEADNASDRFTRVGEHGDEPSAIREALGGLMAPQTLALIVALAMLVGAGWYLTRPPTANELFEKIEAAAAAGDPEQLEAVQSDIDAFLTQFPNDSRARRVQALAEEAQQASPIERAFTEAKRYALINPDLAIRKFQALVDVYDDGPDGSEITRHYVRLARREQARLQRRVDQYVDEGRQLIESRLSKAGEIAAADPPAAKRIYEGIIELYRDKPWADDLVASAQSALDESSKRQTAAH